MIRYFKQKSRKNNKIINTMKESLKKYWNLLLAIILIAAIFIGSGSQMSGAGNIFSGPSKAVAQKAVDFINGNLLAQGQTATLGEVKEASGVYEFKLQIGGQEYTSYVTKDGKLLFTSGIEITTSTSQQTTATTVAKKTCADLTKTEKPLLEAFVVSQCPFGVQMQRMLAEMVKNIPQLAQFVKIEYLGSIENGKVTSMHGEEEAQENLRQVCLREEQPDTFWNYLSCHIKKGEVNSCLTEAKVDQVKLNSCLTDPQKGLAYIQKDFERQNKFGVTGSPTLVLNDNEVSEFDFGGRTAEAIKTVLCCGFSQEPGVCSQKLTTEQAATSYSETYQASGSSDASGGCN